MTEKIGGYSTTEPLTPVQGSGGNGVVTGKPQREASNAAAVVELTALPLSPATQALVAAEPAVRPLLAAGGDDYELLFTAPENAAAAIAGLSTRLGLPIAPIGRIEPGAGVRLEDADGRAIAVAAAGWRHF